MENKTFRKKLLGGFDRNEVIDYIDRLQKDKSEEFDEQKYLDEIESLKNERDALAQALEKANEQLKKLSDPVSGSNSMMASSISHSKAHFESMAALSEEVRRETGENLSVVSDDVTNMLDKANEMRKCFDIASDKLNKDIEKLRFFIDKSAPFFQGEPVKLEDVSQKVVKEEKSAKEILKQGQNLINEAVARQAEIDGILEKIRKKFQ